MVETGEVLDHLNHEAKIASLSKSPSVESVDMLLFQLLPDSASVRSTCPPRRSTKYAVTRAKWRMEEVVCKR